MTTRLIINCNSHRVTLDGRLVAVTPTELSILGLLAFNPSRLITNDQIRYCIHASKQTSLSLAKTHLSNLRRKLGDTAKQRQIIDTVHGVGQIMLLGAEQIEIIGSPAQIIVGLPQDHVRCPRCGYGFFAQDHQVPS